MASVLRDGRSDRRPAPTIPGMKADLIALVRKHRALLKYLAGK